MTSIYSDYKLVALRLQAEGMPVKMVNHHANLDFAIAKGKLRANIIINKSTDDHVLIYTIPGLGEHRIRLEFPVPEYDYIKGIVDALIAIDTAHSQLSAALNK